jgi:ABC-type multidrug transport system ATPase subunit
MVSRKDRSVEFTVKVGNRRIKPANFRKHIAYVTQDDALMATATPREALMFSANMRLATPKKTLESLVDKILDDLGLVECADVIIGGPLIKGISGGQRKRTSVGVELITEPQVQLAATTRIL